MIAAPHSEPGRMSRGAIQQRIPRASSSAHAASATEIDGFPRNLAQARALDAMLAEIDRELDAILFFDLPDRVAVERLLGRAREEGRSDDTPETIARRLEIYHEQTEPVVEHYRASSKLVPLHADRGVGEVQEQIQRALELVRA